MKNYLGVKKLRAMPVTLGEYNAHKGWDIPEDEDPDKQGFLVQYPDGYESWSPADTFTAAYLPMSDDSTRITQEMVDAFVSSVHVSRLGEKNTCVRAVLRNGFELVETSACVDPANYDEKLGSDICMKKIKDKIWFLLGFLLQSGENGFTGAPA